MIEEPPGEILLRRSHEVVIPDGEQMHRITLTATSLAITHLDRCEPDRRACPVAKAAAAAITFPPPVTGTYGCTLDEHGRLLVINVPLLNIDPETQAWYWANTPPSRAAGGRRHCSWLSCPATYDAVQISTGQTTAEGWRQWNSLGLRMCPDHAWVWTPRPGVLMDNGPHGPRLFQCPDNGTEPVLVLQCECGWKQRSLGLTAGKLAETYLVHLLREEQASAARAAFERAGTYLGDTDTLDGMLAEIADKATGSHAIAKRNFYAGGELDYPGAYAVLCHLLTVTAAVRAALGMSETPTATDLMTGEHRTIGPAMFALDGAAHSVWLNGQWRFITSKMADEEREALADAAVRYSMFLNGGQRPAKVNRWWREPESQPASLAGVEEAPIDVAFELSVLTGVQPAKATLHLPPSLPGAILELLVPGGPLLRLNGPDGKALVVIHDDGRVEVPGAAEEAAAAFWEALQASFPGLLRDGSDQWPVYVLDGGIQCNDNGCACEGAEGGTIWMSRRVTLAQLRQAVAAHRNEHGR
ncbi:hypothetical protein JNW90_00900 [Micromonospora sp. STR1s_5]|nr:hypothetical protein [Micromonospora sp. STR1s_5]